MFAEKKKSGSEFSKLPNHISTTSKVKGDIVSEEDFRIDGTFEGNLTTTGKIVLGEKGSLKGIIKCSNAEILGKVSGTLTVDNLLSVKSTANIEGDVVTGKLSIEAGAAFNATCQMKGTAKAETFKKK